MIFGFLIFAESAGAIFTGWVKETFIDPQYTFTVIGFEWLQPLPGDGMYYYFALMAILGIFVMLGYHYRISIGLFTFLWTATYLMQKTNYNNHYYLLILLCIFMWIIPAERYCSLDSKRKRNIAKLTCPRWCISIFKFQILIVFTYATIAKLYPGWLEGDFINLVFERKQSYPIIGSVLQLEWLQKIIVVGGLIFDFLIVYALLWSRTRTAAFILAVVFHLFNSIVFQIGIFPFLMIGMCIFFFDPEKIRATLLKKKRLSYKSSDGNLNLALRQKVILYSFGLYFIVQIVLPLRHFGIKGDVFWTEEGHRLAWRMMLRTKSGTVKFLVKNPTNDSTWLVNPITEVSRLQANSMASKPDMIWQFSQKLKEKYMQQGIEKVEIYAQSRVRLNKSNFHPIIDQNQDLASTKWQRFKHSEWILSPPKE